MPKTICRTLDVFKNRCLRRTFVIHTRRTTSRTPSNIGPQQLHSRPKKFRWAHPPRMPSAFLPRGLFTWTHCDRSEREREREERERDREREGERGREGGKEAGMNRLGKGRQKTRQKTAVIDLRITRQIGNWQVTVAHPSVGILRKSARKRVNTSGRFQTVTVGWWENRYAGEGGRVVVTYVFPPPTPYTHPADMCKVRGHENKNYVRKNIYTRTFNSVGIPIQSWKASQAALGAETVCRRRFPCDYAVTVPWRHELYYIIWAPWDGTTSGIFPSLLGKQWL